MARPARENQIWLRCDYCMVGIYDDNLESAFERLNKHITMECPHTSEARKAA